MIFTGMSPYQALFGFFSFKARRLAKATENHNGNEAPVSDDDDGEIVAGDVDGAVDNVAPEKMKPQEMKVSHTRTVKKWRVKS